MIEEIRGLEIAGKRFETKQTLYFFDGAKEAASKRIALVYGRNGSGKTTIASAFRQVDPMLRDERLSVAIVMDDGSCKLVPQELGDLKEYFFSRMDRLVLNEESHLSFKTKKLSNDGDLFSIFSVSEKQQVARDALCLLYCLDKGHLMAHLGTVKIEGRTNTPEEDIKSWIKSIQKVA